MTTVLPTSVKFVLAVTIKNHLRVCEWKAGWQCCCAMFYQLTCGSKGVGGFCLQDGAPLSQAFLGSKPEDVIFFVISSLQDVVAKP